MDNQLHTFMELCAAPELSGLCEDPRAAWVWSADGSRILWANAAGAAFFSIRDVAGLSRMTGLTRSPARPHIARIATAGSKTQATVDRLRFYRGMRVMLLTCQCQRLTLASGHDAALIICGDKGLASTEPPLEAFLALLSGQDHSAFVLADGQVTLSTGSLSGTPEDLELPDSQRVMCGPLGLQDELHEGCVALIDDAQRLVVLANTPLAREEETLDETAPGLAVGSSSEPAEENAEGSLSDTGDGEEAPVSAEDGDARELEDQDEALPADGWARAQDVAEQSDDAPVYEDEPPLETSSEAGESSTADSDVISLPPLAQQHDSSASQTSYRFIPRRRPIRFAWKMDIDQRFTFISEEFGETLGPAAADVVGLTWDEVARRFDLDVTGSIARALDRRDTWSGKTIDWPVTGTPLRVPVDMAALPAFDRDREFEGYRGFGVCRTGDAVDDPLAPLLETESPSAPEQDEAQADAQSESQNPTDTGELPLDEAAIAAIGEEAEEQSSTASEEVDNLELSSIETEEAVAPNEEASSTEDASLAGDAEGSDRHKEISEEAETPNLREAPKAPLEGGTLLGASAAALLGTLNVQSSAEDAPGAARETDPVEALSGDETVEDGADGQQQTNELPVDEGADDPIGSADRAPEEDELSGISGTAPLHPGEIETAVKTLAKNYGRQPADNASVKVSSEEVSAELPLGDRKDEVSQNEQSEVERPQDVADDELDFFEETAAFRQEETNLPTDETSEPSAAGDADPAHLNRISGENDNGPGSASPAPVLAAEDTDLSQHGGKVVPIGRKPQLVPVDTSRLSRPEKAAFRKIAEALGARLEGDIDGEIDDELEQELEKVDEPPQAGPIDPRLLDRLPIGIAIAHDRDVLYANDTLLDLLGYANLKALTQAGGLEAVFVEDDDDDAWPDAEGMEGTVDGTLKVRLADGGVRPVDARMHSVPWNGSSGLMISFTERTPARQETPAALVPAPPSTSAALQQAESLIDELDTILETATDGVLVLDGQGTIIKVNRSSEALFGASRSDMEGAPLTNYLAPESHRAAADYLDGLARNGVASILNDGREVLGRAESGGLIPLFMTIGRVSTSGGEPKFCAVLRDITQWKTAEEELTQAKRQAENASSQKSDFLAKISHEIRTPLNAIIGFSEVMMEERFGPIGNERYKEYLKDIRTSGSHIMSLINDLLDLSKIEAGKMELHFSGVSLNEVIGECVALMQPQANRDRVIIRASLPESVPSVVADQRSIRQIVLNLLSNAIKFNTSGGQVIVSTALEDSGEVVMRVRDTGVGMSAKDLTAALEPFRQVHTARHGGGTGLGLPLTKALVEANRAGFQIDSTPEQGTLAEIRFPSQRVLAE